VARPTRQHRQLADADAHVAETGITGGNTFGLVFNGNENDGAITLTALAATFSTRAA
jgi:hypothetical protein